MAITPRGATTASTNSGISIAVTLPANLEVGDLILVGIGHRVGSSGTITAPAGWIQIDSQVNSTTVLAAALFRRIAEAGDAGAIVTFESGQATNTKMTAIAQAYGNVDQAAPINGSGAQANASSVNIVAPAITAAAPSLRVMFGSTAYGTTITVTSTWTQSGHISTGGGGSATRNTSAQQSKDDATVDPPSVTAVAGTAAVNIGAQIALKEAPAGTQTPQGVSGALSFAGAIARVAARSTAGALTFAGAIAMLKSLVRGLTGALSFAGSLSKSLVRSVTGALSFAGSLVTQKAVGAAVAGSLTFAGSLLRSAVRGFAGALTFAGALVTQKAVGAPVAGAVSFAGSLSTDYSPAAPAYPALTAVVIHVG